MAQGVGVVESKDCAENDREGAEVEIGRCFVGWWGGGRDAPYGGLKGLRGLQGLAHDEAVQNGVYPPWEVVVVVVVRCE